MIDEYYVNSLFNPLDKRVPASYSDATSLYEDVARMRTYVNSLYNQYVTVKGSNDTLTESYNQLVSVMDNYASQLDQFLNGYTVPPGSVDMTKLSTDIMVQFQTWINNYLHDARNFISFGLEDGYFVVYIPDSWEDIDFSTDVDGHLILEF